MAEYKLFDAVPKHVGAEWHKDREMADHINERGHRERLLQTAAIVQQELMLEGYKSVSDWGAGNGGLLHELKKHYPDVKMWGYDLMPENIRHARHVYNADVSMLDIVDDEPKQGDIIVLTEILEHLVDPHGLIKCLGRGRMVVASSPAFEDHQRHYEFHLWAWTGESYAKMFERAGFYIINHFVLASCGTQFVVASKRLD